MHVVIGLITAIAGLIWALNSLQNAGVDLNSFNPFTWYRRYQWKKKFLVHLAMAAENPTDVAAVILLHTAKLKGELTRETRQTLLKVFQGIFEIGANDANELFSVTSFWLKDGLFEKHVPHFIEARWEMLSAVQAQKVVLLAQKIADLDGAPTPQQSNFISLLKEKMSPKPGSSW